MTKVKSITKNKQSKVEKISVSSTPIVTRSKTTVVSKQPLKDMDEKQQDLEYWLSRPVIERLAAVTFIISQSLKKSQRMDKTIVHFKKMKEHGL